MYRRRAVGEARVAHHQGMKPPPTATATAKTTTKQQHKNTKVALDLSVNVQWGCKEKEAEK